MKVTIFVRIIGRLIARSYMTRLAIMASMLPTAETTRSYIASVGLKLQAASSITSHSMAIQ